MNTSNDSHGGGAGPNADTSDSQALSSAEGLYASIICNLPTGVAIFRYAQGIYRFELMNDAWFEVHHRAKTSELPCADGDALSLVHEPDRAKITAEQKRVGTTKDIQGDAVVRVQGDDGNLHWVEMRFRFAYLKEGDPCYYASFDDLDAQKRTEEKLAESQATLEEAVANSDIQFFTYYPDKRRCENYLLNNRLNSLPTAWEDFPESFLAYTQAPPEDAEEYRKMLEEVCENGGEAERTVRFLYHGTYIWERVRAKAIYDSDGNMTKIEGCSLNVTERRKAEEMLQQEQRRLRSLEGDLFEAFSFNLSKNSEPNIQTLDKKMLEGETSNEQLQEALSIAPALGNANPKTRDILLRAAARIPDVEDRRLFIVTCSADAMRKAVSQGSYSAEIRYRRYVGDKLHWVTSSAEVVPDPETGDLIAFYYTRDINDEIIRGTLADRIINTNYRTVSLIDLETMKLRIIATKDPLEGTYNGMDYEKAVAYACRHTVLPEEADTTRKELAIEILQAELAKEPVRTLYFSRKEQIAILPNHPYRRIKCDLFYLDRHENIIVMLQSDVTELAEKERDVREKMAQALAAAEQASVAKTEFLSRMSHEIRTPMNAIIGLDAIALQEEGLSTSMEDHLRKIGISAHFLLSLINDILDMSRIESGRMMLKAEPFDFEQFVNSINTILYEQCRDNGLEYECVLKSFTEPTYVGDATKLQQVLVNILGNAVKFTPEGGKIRFNIEQLSRTKKKARLRFEISDTGIGIDDKFLPHLFEPFSQEERGRTSTYGGSGLGLAISKNIINLMGGDISVHSIKNVGSEFTVEVHVGLSEETQHRRIDLMPSMLHLQTLIVDDDIIVCQHTQAILNDAGFKAEWVDSGTDAVERVEQQHRANKDFDLILLDWKMPVMDGVETAREIRKIVGPEITIIIMTAFDWSDIEKKARAAGVDMFMRKPLFASSVTKAFENVFLKKKGEAHDEETPNYDFSDKRVLLAEDNDLNAEIAKSILTMKGCTVDVVGNGAEAVEAFAASGEGHFDAILMDVRMPAMDGLEATKTIRAMRKQDSKTIPIIAMTANAFQEDVNQSLEAGMNAHLAKPIEPPVLYATLQRFFDKAADER